MAKEKKKKKPKWKKLKEKKERKSKAPWKGQLIIFICILAILLPIISITEPGTYVYQMIADKYKQKKWAEDLQFKIAKTHSFWGRSYLAAKAFRIYLNRYDEDNFLLGKRVLKVKASPERVMHASFWEASSLQDARMYKSCWERSKDFLDRYGDEETGDKKADEFIVKMRVLEMNMKAMNQSKRVDHQIYSAEDIK